MSDGAATEHPVLAPVEEFLELACRAPSVHNTQPWQWHQHGNRLDLFADDSRRLPHADPDGRDLLLSCGAALQHLHVAAAGLGWSVRVRRLPDPDDPRHIATVTVAPARATAEAEARLRALSSRQTDRRRFTSWPVTEGRLHSLAAAGSTWGAQVLPIGEAVRNRLLRLTLRANGIQCADPGYLAELHGWPQAPRNRVREWQAEADAMLIVCTSSNDPISQLRAGEAMSAVWLQATLEQLSVVPLGQALEVPDTRREIQQQVLNGLAHPQILLRVGWLPVARSRLPMSPRRPVEDVLTRH